MTRRSFFGLFGAGVAGAVVAATMPWPVAAESVILTPVVVPGVGIVSDGIVARKLYRSSSDGKTFKLIATITNNEQWTYTDTMSDITFDHLPVVGHAVSRRL